MNKPFLPNCNTPIIMIFILMIISACKQEELTYDDDMYLFISYQIDGESFQICENILQLEISCESWNETRFFGSPILNLDNSYNFRAYLGDDVAWNSVPNFTLDLLNVSNIIGTHQIDNGSNFSSIQHNFRVNNSGNVVGAYSTNGSVTISRISEQTYNFNNFEYKILYGNFNAEMRKDGADVQLSGIFQFPFRNN